MINIDVLGRSTKRMIASVESITTQDLLEKNSTKEYYVAGVVNATQYIPDHRMRYYLGAEDSTTDSEGHTFYNKELGVGLAYFFRVFSIDSTLGVCQNFVYNYVSTVYPLFRMRYQLPQIP